MPRIAAVYNTVDEMGVFLPPVPDCFLLDRGSRAGRSVVRPGGSRRVVRGKRRPNHRAAEKDQNDRNPLGLGHTKSSNWVDPPEFYGEAGKSCQDQIEPEYHAGRIVSFPERPENSEDH